MEIKELALFNFFELASKFFSRNENKYNKDSNYFTEFLHKKIERFLESVSLDVFLDLIL